MDNFEERVESTLETFRKYVKDRGYKTTPDERIRERVAADLLGLAPKTLRTMRGGLQGPAFIKTSGAVWYRLHDLAHYVEISRYETVETALRGA